MKHLFVILALLLIAIPVSGYDRIAQGSTVYIGETYDISGTTGWAEQIAWYGESGRYSSDSTPIQILNLPNQAHTAQASQYYYTISNDVFGDHLGGWYQYYGAETGDEHGNLLAFYVEKTRPIKITSTNTTTGMISYIVGGNDTYVKTPDNILPEVRVADYLLARGDDFDIPVYNTTNAWLFGRISGLYNYRSVNNSVELRKDLILGMETGDYTLVLQTPTTEYFTVRYNEELNTIEWFDEDWFVVRKIHADGFSPRVFLDKMREIIPNTRDTFREYNLTIQDPSVSIVSVDERYVGGISILDVRGYTNTNPGTVIKLILDEDKQIFPHEISAHTYSGVAKGEMNGNMRYYQIYVPIAWDDVAPGMHTIKATTDVGGAMYYDFPIFEMPADSYRPNATLKYINDRNPWIPTPTPEVRITIIEKQVVVERTIKVNVTPSNEQLAAIRASADYDVIKTVVGWLVLACVLFIVFGLGGKYALDVYRRAKK